jgi:acyl carrier protein
VAGERCPGELVERHFQSLPNSVLYNEYGPTEATVWCTVFRFEKGESRTVVPIGRPIANTQVYILDTHLQPVPIGVAGELYIGGEGLAREYLHRPELTAERFIPHPFSKEPGARLYKTGDRVRYLVDGNIEFLDRFDQQVKIRGYRIESGEIEGVLRQHPDVKEAAVVAREDIPGDKRLIAYVVPYVNMKENIIINDLHRYLVAYLPVYMLPSAYIVLETLPKLPNGKLDRRALPVPGTDQLRPGAKNLFVAPRTQIEEVVAASWSEALGIDQVSIHDDFFTLGGHSLLAMQVVAHLRTTLQVELTLRNFFEAPTIAALAETITLLKANNTRHSMSTIRSISRENHRVTLSSIFPTPGRRDSRNEKG